ncbi:MAG: hypothetical protein KKD44_03090 [Proteobacteria bacterium]|nr:hypothetical protein [Pseudomonadota bacterium]
MQRIGFNIHDIAWITWITTALLFVGLPLAQAQEEVASSLRRYKNRDASTGYYEQYEASPTSDPSIVSVPGVGRGVFSYSPSAAKARIRRRLTDSHMGIKFYESLRCVNCHSEQAKSYHVARANLSCRQCHGVEPIASIDHFYSPMNPIRRHAYVCAKCHEGASVSFGSYMVHEPPAGSEAAKTQFPLLYYTYWFMVFLLVGTLSFFIPHSFMVGVRELVIRIKEETHHGDGSH